MRFLDRDHGWAIFCGALVMRLAVFSFILARFGDAGFILPPFSDGHGYVTIANNILEHRGFSLDEAEPFTPDLKRVPLYPLFLSATFLLAGGSWWLASFLQTIIGAAVALLLYKITDSFAGRRAAFIAGTIAAIHPFSIFLSTQLLAETMFTCVALASFALFMQAVKRPSALKFVYAGAAIGVATLIKPAGQYMACLLFPFIALFSRGMHRLIYPTIYIACFVLVLTPWVARNHSVTGHTTLSFEANILFDLHVAGYLAFKETGSASNAQAYRWASNTEEVLSHTRGEYIARIVTTAVNDPIGFGTYLAISTIPFIFGDGFVTMARSLSPDSQIPPWNFSLSPIALAQTIGFGTLPPGLIIVSLVGKTLWGIVLVGAVWGFVHLIRSGKERMLIAIAIAFLVAYLMFAGGPVQSARYRAPVEPLIFMLAGIGIAHMLEIHALRRRKLSHVKN
jgi:4-amino-4-deoxy-L-arabinose transferase-like glycosyltransferase